MKQNLPHNFGALPKTYSSYKHSKVVILPVPFDRTSSWLKGSDKGPEAIIEASRHMELYDIETGSEVYKSGLHTAAAIRERTSARMVDAVHERVRKYLRDGKFTVLLGGEHTVSFGAITAHLDRFPGMSILHLDAHSDMRDSYWGDKWSHACVMARVREHTDRIVSAGIRSMDASELKNINTKNMFYASSIRRSKTWISRVLKRLSGDVYISLDLDVFDPSLVPSTGTPEPGGMGWYEVLDLLESVSARKNVVGCDVVELCPSNNRYPDFLAAKLIYKILSFRFRT